jgi:hypothetical protein
LLGSIAIGAVAGGLIGKFTDRKVKAGMDDLAEKLPPGTAGVITVFDDEHRLAIEKALPGSSAKSVTQTDKEGIRALKAELADAMGKFVQDRSALPIPDRTFGGTAGRTLKESVADWSMIPGPKAPDGAPNVLAPPPPGFRACWVTQAESRFRLTSRMWTRMDPISIANTTYSVRSQTVSTGRALMHCSPSRLLGQTRAHEI